MPKPKPPLPRGTIDETGKKYGFLRVLQYAGNDSAGKAATWLCRCSCKQPGCLGTVEVRGTRLRDGTTTSCGRARANPAIRKAAALQIPAARRREIASAGGVAKKKNEAARRRAADCKKCGGSGKVDRGNGTTKPCDCAAGLVERDRRSKTRR